MAVGAGDAAGATTISTSTTITISIGIRILAAATETISEAETAHRNNPAVVALEEAEEIPVGSTIRNIVGARPIATVRPQTGLAALREVTPLLTVRLVPDNSLAVRAAICPAIALQATGSAIGQVEELGRAIEQEVERIASEAGISHAAAVETEMPSAEVPEVPRVTTDRAHEPAAIAVLPAWALEVAEAVSAAAVAVVGAGDGAGKRS